MVLVQWLLAYLAIAVVAHFFTRRISNFRIQVLYIHLFVGVSVVLLALAGARLEWHIGTLSILTVIVVFLLAVLLLGRLGFLYGLSSALQEACLLLSATFLATVTGFPIASIATAAPYVFAHRTEGSEWYWKPVTLLLWCVGSVYLYLWLEQPLLNISLHIFLGTILIHKKLLYRLEDMMSDLDRLIKPDKYQVFLVASCATFPLSFAQHPWFIVNKKGDVSRWEVAWKPGRYGEKKYWGHITFNILPPFVGLRRFLVPRTLYSKARLLNMIEGDEGSLAAKMAEFIERSPETYPFKDQYRFRGPNSNTYVQWIIDQFPESGFKLPWNASGKGYRITHENTFA